MKNIYKDHELNNRVEYDKAILVENKIGELIDAVEVIWVDGSQELIGNLNDMRDTLFHKREDYDKKLLLAISE